MENKQCPPWIARKRGFQEGMTHAINNIFLDDAEETRGCYQHRESIVLPNLDMIFDKCRNNKLSAEEYVQIKLKRMGYQVIDCRRVGDGHPDFIAIKNNTRVFVEVKSTEDGLRMEQGKWIMKHPQNKVIIYWVDYYEN